MVAHGPLGEVQPGGNVAIGQPLRQQAQHIHFALGELVGELGRRAACAPTTWLTSFPATAGSTNALPSTVLRSARITSARGVSFSR